MALDARKKWILKIAAALLGVILIITVFSSTIYNMNLPVVTVGFGQEGSISNTARGTGAVAFISTRSYFADIEGVVAFLVQEGDIVAKGEPLYSITPVGVEANPITEAERALAIERAIYSVKAEELKLADVDAQIAALNSQTSDAGDTAEMASLAFQLVQKQRERERIIENDAAYHAEQLAVFNENKDAALADVNQAIDTLIIAINAQRAGHVSAVQALEATITQYALTMAAAHADLASLERQRHTGSHTGETLAALQLQIDKAMLNINATQANIDKARADIADYESKISILADCVDGTPVADLIGIDYQLDDWLYKLDGLYAQRAEIAGRFYEPDLKSTALTAIDDEIESLQFRIEQAEAAAREAADGNRAQLDSLKRQRGMIQNSLLLAQKDLAILQLRADDEKTAVVITAETDCAITALCTETGAYTGAYTKLLETGNIEGGYRVRLTFPEAAADIYERMAARMSDTGASGVTKQPELTLRIPSNMISGIQGTVVRMETEDGSLYLTAEFAATGLVGGEMAWAQLQSGGRYDVVLPNSAIHVVNDDYYVLLVQRRKSSIGWEYVLTRFSASVMDSDNRNTAIIWLPEDASVVINSDYPVYDGMRVRLADGADFESAR